MKIPRAVWAFAAALSAAPLHAIDAPPPAAGEPPPIQRGEVVVPFEAVGIDGKARPVQFHKGTRTVLLFFLSSCSTCHKMIPEWNRAYERRPAGLNIVGVLMDQPPPGFFSATPVAFPVVRSPGRAALASYKINRVPMTVRVGPGGKVEDAEMGIIDPIRLGEIFRP